MPLVYNFTIHMPASIHNSLDIQDVKVVLEIFQ